MNQTTDHEYELFSVEAATSRLNLPRFAPETCAETPEGWRAVRAEGAETCRWMSTCGHWIRVFLLLEDEAVAAIVEASTGQRHAVDSLEEAIRSARSWMAS